MGTNNGRRGAISPEDAQELIEAYFEGGLENLHSTREAARELVNERFEQMDVEDEEIAEGAGTRGTGETYRRLDENEAERQRLLAAFHPAHPTWQQASGLFPQAERAMSPNERAGRIRGLLGKVERLLRFEMKNAAQTANENRTDGRWTGRSLQWNPLREICFQMEIAQQRLSSYSKEQTGLSAPEIVDCIRAEGVRGKMKTALKEFVNGFFSRKDAKTQRTATARSTTEDTEGTEEKIGDEIWRALKETRSGPRWHRTVWAASFGYSSYAKFFRACLYCYGMTPHQLEMELIDEILLEAEKDNCNGNGNHEGHEEKTGEHEGRQNQGDVVKNE